MIYSFTGFRSYPDTAQYIVNAIIIQCLCRVYNNCSLDRKSSKNYR